MRHDRFLLSLMRRIIAGLSIITVCAIPLAASARRPVTDIVNSSVPTVSRRSFVLWAVEAIGFPSSNSADCTLPIRRATTAQKRLLCIALEKGVFQEIEPTDDFLRQPISRGEALQVLTALMDTKADSDVSAYRDVRTVSEKQAVMNAVQYHWMVPLTAHIFGLQRPLRGVEAMSVLTAVSGTGVLQPGESGLKIDVAPGGASSVPMVRLPHQELLEVIWHIIQRDYLHADKIDAQEALYRAIEGMVASLKDPYTSFFRAPEADEFVSQLEGDQTVVGIGAHVEDRGGVVTIVAPLTGSPAQRAGLLPGDEILEADSHQLTGIGLESAVRFIRGQKGTVVKLKIRRNGSEISIAVERDVVSVPEITVGWLDDNIAEVQLVQFGEHTEKSIRAVFEEVAKHHVRGIVLDLRNNPGGLLGAAVTLVSNFVPKGTPVVQVIKHSETITHITEDEPTVDPAVKLVVLINKGSASASEIVASALQDLKRARIIGQTSFGKGSVQEFVNLNLKGKGGEALKLTIAKFVSPAGHQIDGIGVNPDETIVDDGKNRDAVLRRATELLRF